MFTFGGLATGLDTNSLINGLMAAERVPLQRLQAKQSSLQAAQSTLSDVLGKISSIGVAADELATASGFASMVATSSSSAVVASTSGASVAGNFTVDVLQLAQEQRSRSDLYPSSTAALGQAGNLDITVGSDAAVSIAVVATDSLADVASKINSSGARVAASVVQDGTGYRLLVRGTDTGAANSFSVSGVALGLDQAPNSYQAAQDAQILLDSTFSLSSATNQFTGVVQGLDLAVTQTTASPVTVGVASDPTELVGKITTLVEAFNDGVDAAQRASGYGAFDPSQPELASDSTLRRALGQLSGAISSPVSGLTGKYDMLASAGLHLTRDGKLELDQSAFEAALADDPVAVQKLFVGDPSTSTTGAMSALGTVVDKLTDGTSAVLQQRIDAMGEQATHIDDQVIDMNRYLDDYEQYLVKKFTALEILVSQIQAQENALAGFVNSATGHNQQG